jgi:heme O synthase-like polyprenyltransferase
MDYLEFIKPELLSLILVGYFIGMALKKCEKIKDWTIPFIIGGMNIVLAVVYLFSISDLLDSRKIAALVFTGFVQGALTAAGAVYGNQLKKQATVGRAEDAGVTKTTKVI